MFVVCGLAMAFTVELDPVTPLNNYVSLGEWNTNDDFDDWTTHQTADPAVYDGSITGRVDGNDMNISLDVTTFTDPRSGNVFITGSVYEIRIRFDPFTENQRSEFFPTMDGTFKIPPVTFASNADPALPDVENDGLFHVYRITLDTNDTFYLGKLDVIRFDILADAAVIGETFEVDYFRIANVITNIPYVDPLTVDGEPIPYYTSLGEWNTNGDFENWYLSSITNEEVSEGILSGEPINTDPWILKMEPDGLPPVDLMYAPYAEFRLKQDSSINNSSIEIFFGTTNNPWISGARHVAIGSGSIPADGQFHIYRYDLSQHPDWDGVLQAFRVDPYTVYTSQRFEIDYIRVGDLVPEPSLLLGIVLVLCFVKILHPNQTNQI